MNMQTKEQSGYANKRMIYSIFISCTERMILLEYLKIEVVSRFENFVGPSK